MASGTFTAGTIDAQSGFSPSADLTDLSAQDTDWALAASNSANPYVYLSNFGIGGTLDAGTGNQTATVQVKEHGGNATPTVRIDIYYNGTLKKTGTSNNITSATGETFAETFDTTVLGGNNPSLVQIRIIVTAGTTPPPQSCSADVGYLGWSANYSPLGPISGNTGTSVGAITGTLCGCGYIDGTAAGTGAVAGDLKSKFFPAGEGIDSIIKRGPVASPRVNLLKLLRRL